MKRLITIAILLFTSAALAQAPPYSQSTIFTGITWDCGSQVTAASGSDLFPVTWHSDGHLYTGWGDGGGFENPTESSPAKSSLGISRLTGTPSSIGAEDILCDQSVCATNPTSDGINPDSWSNSDGGGKILGIISAKGKLYGWFSMQDGTFPNVTYRLGWSTDNGAHWTLDTESFSNAAGTFSPRSFLQYGQAYGGGDPNYVYALGHNKWSTLSDLQDVYLMRMPFLTLEDKATYQWFSGTASNPQWSGDVAQRQPIFNDPEHVGRTAHISYIPLVDRYLLAVPHGIAGSLTTLSIGLFESQNPWGPWATIDYQTGSWCGNFGDLSLGFDIVTKTPDWLSADGLTLTVVWSGTGTFDRYNHIQGTLSLTAATDLHVSPTGSGTACTDQTPCVFSQAQTHLTTHVGHAHSVVFHDGTYGWFDTVTANITYRAKNSHMTIIANASSHTGGVYAVGIRHDGTVLDGLRITGQQTGGGSGHALVRWFESAGTVVRNSIIEESAGGLLNVCGSIGFDNCSDITIEDNVLRKSGYVDTDAEGVYIAQFEGNNTVTGVIVRRNTFQEIGCEQALDVKPGGVDVEAHNNIFEGQFDRGAMCTTDADGVFVSQGDLYFHSNIVRNNILGESVFRPSTAGTIIENNSVYSNSHTGNLIRTRGAGSGTQTEIFDNSFCNNSNQTIEAVFNDHDNTFDDTGIACVAKEVEILGAPGPESIPLAECR